MEEKSTLLIWPIWRSPTLLTYLFGLLWSRCSRAGPATSERLVDSAETGTHTHTPKPAACASSQERKPVLVITHRALLTAVAIPGALLKFSRSGTFSSRMHTRALRKIHGWETLRISMTIIHPALSANPLSLLISIELRQW